jgi:hypothetical protein
MYSNQSVRSIPPHALRAAVTACCCLVLATCSSDQAPTSQGPPGAADTVAADTVAADTVAADTVATDTVATDTVATDTVAADTVTGGTPTDSTAMLIGAGDIAGCGDNYKDDATAALLRRPEHAPATVYTLGDNAYPDGTEEQFRCYQASWGVVKDRTRPVPGNHEYHEPEAGPYYDYFGALAGEPGKGYYSYDLAGWHIVALNSERRRSEQLEWLRNDLAAHPAKCTLAYWHQPFFTSAVNHPPAEQMEPFWDVLYQAGAEVVISGHNHHYERFAPQRTDGTADSRGIRQFVVGTGGNPLIYDFRSPAMPNSQVRWGGHGVLKLTLFSDRYSFEFISIEGSAFTDSGSGVCH